MRDSNNKLLPIDLIGNQDIVELRVKKPINILMLCLAIIIFSTFLFLSVCVGGLVFVKFQTNRIIKAYNENMQSIDIIETVPINVMSINDEYGNESSFNDKNHLKNFNIKNSNYIQRAEAAINELHHNIIITKNYTTLIDN